MVRTLQKKFIKASMLAISALILVIFIAINIYSIISATSTMNSTMDLLARYDGQRSNINNHAGQADLPGSRRQDFDLPLSDGTGQSEDQALSGDPSDVESTEDGYDSSPDQTPSENADQEETFGKHEDTEGKGPRENSDEAESFVEEFMGGRDVITKTDEDTFLTSSYFTVKFNSDGEATYVGIDQIASITEDNAIAIAEEVYSRTKNSGSIGAYIYRVVENDANGEYTVILLDTSEERSAVLRMFLISLGISAAAWLIMYALIRFLSKKAIRPIAENITRQKQFVTNAGHELKTPLAIIQSNTEAMELFNGENKWSRNIKAQVSRLSLLTQNLLTLSRMDESADSMVMEDLNISEMASEHYTTFANSFSQKSVTCESHVQPDIHYKGDRSQITQLFNLLFDNAVKYTNEGGHMEISLVKKGTKPILVMKNTCAELPECPPDKLFDRFYRSDESHSQKTGGHGIGLSVVASIAENHGASVTAEYDETGSAISFIVKF